MLVAEKPIGEVWESSSVQYLTLLTELTIAVHGSPRMPASWHRCRRIKVGKPGGRAQEVVNLAVPGSKWRKNCSVSLERGCPGVGCDVAKLAWWCCPCSFVVGDCAGSEPPAAISRRGVVAFLPCPMIDATIQVPVARSLHTKEAAARRVNDSDQVPYPNCQKLLFCLASLSVLPLVSVFHDLRKLASSCPL